MEAKQYIQEFLKKDTTLPAQVVYDSFVKDEQGECTYPYFRTLYNRMKDEVLRNITSAPINLPARPQTVEPTNLDDIEIQVVHYDDQDIITLDNDVIPTGTVFDKIVCEEVKTADMDDTRKVITCGLVRKCVDVVAGKAGSGKTVSRVYLAAEAVYYNKKFLNKEIKALFISGEMQEFEWKREIIKLPLLKLVDVMYISSSAGDPDYEDKLRKAICSYDLIVADSFPIFVSHIRMCKNEKRTEKDIIIDLINLFRETAEEGNTNVQLINQANKDGNYKGGTELPHMTSSLSFVEVDESKRSTIFRKNRNNGTTVNQRLYFHKVGDTLKFDEDTYTLMYLQDNRIKDFEDLLEEIHVPEEASNENLTTEI